MSEETWIAKRSELRHLLKLQPHWTNQMYADALGMSLSWVKDWKRVFKQGNKDAAILVLGRPRHRRSRFEDYEPEIIQAVLDIRDQPPDYCPRVPGPAVIQYELQRQFADSKKRYPRSTSTIWGILDEHQRIIRKAKPTHQPFDRPDPMKNWEIDFTDVTTVPADPEGKRQHAVEMLNVVDRGTSILIESTASNDYTAATSILAMTGVFLVEGLPDVITMDRDPRFIGGWQGDDFPSVFMRFLLSLNIKLDICPPRRPDLKPFVERVHRTIDEECIQIKRPDTDQAVCDVLHDYRFRYNTIRPHQGRACGNRPPYQAFPTLPYLRRLPETIDPDHWLKTFHGRYYKRKVQANGSVKMDKHPYYVGRHLKGQTVLLQVDADACQFHITHRRQYLKSADIKGLYGELMDFEVYLKLICEEAYSEWRETKRLVRGRRMRWVA